MQLIKLNPCRHRVNIHERKLNRMLWIFRNTRSEFQLLTVENFPWSSVRLFSHLQNFKGTGNNKIFSVGMKNLEVVFLGTCYSKQSASYTVHSKQHSKMTQGQQPVMNVLSKHRNLLHPLFNFRTSSFQNSSNNTRKTGHAKPVLLLLCRKSRMSWSFRAW